jgi:hypothetical protein
MAENLTTVAIRSKVARAADSSNASPSSGISARAVLAEAFTERDQTPHPVRALKALCHRLQCLDSPGLEWPEGSQMCVIRSRLVASGPLLRRYGKHSLK